MGREAAPGSLTSRTACTCRRWDTSSGQPCSGPIWFSSQATMTHVRASRSCGARRCCRSPSAAQQGQAPAPTGRGRIGGIGIGAYPQRKRGSSGRRARTRHLQHQLRVLPWRRYSRRRRRTEPAALLARPRRPERRADRTGHPRRPARSRHACVRDDGRADRGPRGVHAQLQGRRLRRVARSPAVDRGRQRRRAARSSSRRRARRVIR